MNVAQRTWAFCMAAVLLVAIAVRGATVGLRHDAAIDMDGSEYVRVAQNILDGHGAIGMRGFPMVIFPPLYSWTIALLVRAGFAPENAALTIAFLGGCAFVLAVAALVARIYDRRTALAAALVAAVLPICVDTSTTALTEAPFGAFATVGLWSLVQMIRSWSWRAAAVCGAAFGAAYLLRPEGALFALAALAIATTFALVARRRLIPVAVLGASALLLALPSIVATELLVGHVVLEGKSAINFRLADGMRSGASYLAIADAVDASGRPVGPEIDPRFYAPDQAMPQFDLRHRLMLAALAARAHLRDVPALFTAGAYGSGLLILLGVLGIFGTALTRRGRHDEAILIAYAAVAFVALAGVWQMWPRYGMLLLPVVLVWTGGGIAHLRRWSVNSRLPDAGVLALGLLVAVCVAGDVANARSADAGIERTTGAWIAAHPVPGPVVDVSTGTAFYAGATWSPLPYGDETASARYLRKLAPSYVVLDSSRAFQYPPLQRWFEHGLPTPLATRAFAVADARGRRLTVYRFAPQRAGAVTSSTPAPDTRRSRPPAGTDKS
jgi:4-amino-4-deoxy-L-arabinose transferase-like glycosyltransferase